jgi:hypothetical protein
MKLKYRIEAAVGGQIFEVYVGTLAAANREAKTLKRAHPGATITIVKTLP